MKSLKKAWAWFKDNIFWVAIGVVLFVASGLAKIVFGRKPHQRYPHRDPPRDFDSEVKDLDKELEKWKEENDEKRDKDLRNNPFGGCDNCDCAGGSGSCCRDD